MNNDLSDRTTKSESGPCSSGARFRPHERAVECNASSTNLRNRAPCLRTDSPTVSATYLSVPIGTPWHYYRKSS